MPRVTVVIPTYNWSTVLPYSIGSVLLQRFRDFEVLVVGDCCTDDSAEVVSRIEDARVRWINLPERSGHQSTPNNEAIRQARGDLIAYLGHDDLWLPHHLEILVAAIDAGANLAHGLTESVGLEGRAPVLMPRHEQVKAPFRLPPSCVLHRRSLVDEVGGWRDYRDLHVFPEDDLWQRIIDAGHRLVLVPRLNAIKIAAGLRKDVYKQRPCHEQAAWLQRIQTEDDLEAVELARMAMVEPLTLSEMLRRQIKVFKDRIALRRRLFAGLDIDKGHAFKGVDDTSRRRA